MKAPEIFGILVRVVGLVFTYQTIQSLVALVNLVGFVPKGSHIIVPYASVLNLIILACAAVWFLRGAPPLPSLAYPNGDAKSPNPDSETSSPAKSQSGF